MRQFVLSDCYITDRLRVVEGVEQDMGLICIVNDSLVCTIKYYNRAYLSCWKSSGSLILFSELFIYKMNDICLCEKIQVVVGVKR
jgi:hypothetical protein